MEISCVRLLHVVLNDDAIVIDSFLCTICGSVVCHSFNSPLFILRTNKMAVDASSVRRWSGIVESVGDIPRMTPLSVINVL